MMIDFLENNSRDPIGFFINEISLKLITFGPCIILLPYLAGSSGFWPPCFIIEPPTNTILLKLKN